MIEVIESLARGCFAQSAGLLLSLDLQSGAENSITWLVPLATSYHMSYLGAHKVTH